MPRHLTEGMSPLDPGTISVNSTTMAVTVTSVWGVDSAGNPYYDDTGVTVGEEAALWRDNDGGLVLVELEL